MRQWDIEKKQGYRKNYIYKITREHYYIRICRYVVK